MNNRYLACQDCKIYIDVGYRWAYWELEEPGIVARGDVVNVEAVLAANSYWSPPRDEGSRWLYEKVFPPLRCFLQDHKSHQIVFGEQDDFAPLEDEFFDWMQLGFALMPTPRYLVEVLGLKSWDQVRVYMKERKLPAAWWEMTWCGDPSPHETGRQKFEDLLKEKYGGDR